MTAWTSGLACSMAGCAGGADLLVRLWLKSIWVWTVVAFLQRFWVNWRRMISCRPIESIRYSRFPAVSMVRDSAEVRPCSCWLVLALVCSGGSGPSLLVWHCGWPVDLVWLDHPGWAVTYEVLWYGVTVLRHSCHALFVTLC